MLSLAPKLHELTGTAASRTIAQLRELGVEPPAGPPPSQSPSRRSPHWASS